MKTAKQILVVVIGTAIAAFGVCLAIHAGFGGATLAVLWEGIHRSTGLTIGVSSFLLAFLMVAFCWFYDRKQISWGTVIYQVVYSVCLDFYNKLIVYPDSRLLNALIMLLGIVILDFGLALYSYADFGRGPYEALTLAFVNRNGWKTVYVRTILDGLCVLIGVLLGGKIGLCTVMTVLVSGWLFQTFLALFRKIDEKIHLLSQ